MRIWLLLNSAAIAALALAQWSVLRQIGLMLTRLGPIGARTSSGDGPRVGEYVGPQIASLRQTLPPSPPDLVIIFGSVSCSICQDVREAAQALAPHWNSLVQLIIVYDEHPQATVDENKSVGLTVFHSKRGIREELAAKTLPFGVRVDGRDRVLGSGIVNNISHVESLLELRPDDYLPAAALQTE